MLVCQCAVPEQSGTHSGCSAPAGLPCWRGAEAGHPAPVLALLCCNFLYRSIS